MHNFIALALWSGIRNIKFKSVSNIFNDDSDRTKNSVLVKGLVIRKGNVIIQSEFLSLRSRKSVMKFQFEFKVLKLLLLIDNVSLNRRINQLFYTYWSLPADDFKKEY